MARIFPKLSAVLALLIVALAATSAANAAQRGSAPAKSQTVPRPPIAGRLLGKKPQPPTDVRKASDPGTTIATEEQGPDGAAANANTTSPLYYHVAGAYVQPSPRIYIVYWGDWSGDTYGVKQRLYWFYRSVGGSSWNQTQTQYGMNCIAGTTNCTSSSTMIRNTTNQLKNWVNDISSPPASPTEADMAAEARWAASYFGDDGYETQYVIALAPGHRDQKSIANRWCAWHNYTTTATGYLVSYTSMPYLPDMGTTCAANAVMSGNEGVLDGVTIYAGHEYAESETDPYLNAWLDSSNNENGDKCLFGTYRRVTFASTGLTFTVQPLWNAGAFSAGTTPCYFWS
jgi:serine protease